MSQKPSKYRSKKCSMRIFNVRRKLHQPQ